MSKLGFYILYILTRPLAILPLGFHRAMGRLLGCLMGRYRRNVVLVNLAKAFPEKKYKELSEICDAFYAHLGKVIAESIWFGGPGINKKLPKSHLVNIENPEFLGEYYDKGQMAFVLCSHTGNWELYGGLLSYCDPMLLKYGEKEVSLVYKKLSSQAWDLFMYRNRCNPVCDKKNYDGLQESKNMLRYVVSHRNERKLYFCIMDQYPYAGAAKVPVSFMGQPTYSMTAFPTLASKMAAPVLYLSYKEKEDGNYSMRFSTICEDASKMAVEDILKEYYNCLEEDLRAQAWNYLWTHKRWK